MYPQNKQATPGHHVKSTQTLEVTTRNWNGVPFQPRCEVNDPRTPAPPRFPSHCLSSTYPARRKQQNTLTHPPCPPPFQASNRRVLPPHPPAYPPSHPRLGYLIFRVEHHAVSVQDLPEPLELSVRDRVRQPSQPLHTCSGTETHTRRPCVASTSDECLMCVRVSIRRSGKRVSTV